MDSNTDYPKIKEMFHTGRSEYLMMVHHNVQYRIIVSDQTGLAIHWSRKILRNQTIFSFFTDRCKTTQNIIHIRGTSVTEVPSSDHQLSDRCAPSSTIHQRSNTCRQ